MDIIEIKKIEKKMDTKNIYLLNESKFNMKKYLERVSRNIGWISKEEQIMLRNTTVGIAGCGGMGGLIAVTLLRLGVGTIKIADNDSYEISNINRQSGANAKTIGKSKSIETASQLRKISTDLNIHIYPMGITKESVEKFVLGCDFIFDEIEFWAIGSRILLHDVCHKYKVDFLNCNTVGFQSNLFYFNSLSEKLSSYINLSQEDAFIFEENFKQLKIDLAEKKKMLELITKAFVPNIPTYGKFNDGTPIESFVIEKILLTNNASILSTNPVFSCGLVCNFFITIILRYSGTNRKVKYPPLFPSYITIDSTKLFSKIIKR